MRGLLIFRRNGKLKPIFISSYNILKRMGDMVYRLSLSAILTLVYLVFHVSMLR